MSGGWFAGQKGLSAKALRVKMLSDYYMKLSRDEGYVVLCALSIFLVK